MKAQPKSAGSNHSSSTTARSNSGGRSRKKTARHIPTDRDIDRSLYLLSYEDFDGYFTEILRDDAEASHSLAEMMLRFMDATLDGPRGSVKAIHSYKDGIEILYHDTAAHDLSLDLYLAWLRGELKPEDEPVTLIKGAIARRTARRSARRGRAAGQNKQPGKNNEVKITDKAAARGSKKPATAPGPGNPRSSQQKNRPPASPASGLHRRASGEPTETPVSAAGRASK